MNFFKHLSETGIKDLTIEIKTAQDGRITVLTTPKSISQDKGLKSIKPLFLTASAEELDEGYFQAITKPLKQTAEVFNNVESYEAQLSESAKNTEAAKKEQNAEKLKKEKIKKNEDNLKKYVESLKEPRHWVTREEKILSFISSINDLDTNNKYAATVKKELEIQKAKASSGTLFEETVTEHVEPEFEIPTTSIDEEEEEEESDDYENEELI